MRLHSMESSLFIWKRFNFLENNLESLLIFVLFLRVNKIRKKTLSVTPYFGKNDIWKPKYEFEGQVIYWEGTVKTNTPLSP